MKKIFVPFVILSGFLLQAQIKIGTSPTIMSPNALLQINGEAGNGNGYDENTMVFKDKKLGIGTLNPQNTLEVKTSGTTETASIALMNLNGGRWFFNAPPALPMSDVSSSLFIWQAPASGETGLGACRFIINKLGRIGIGTTSPLSELHVNGGIYASSIQGPSDKRFKKNIEPLQNSLEKIIALSGYTYEWRKEEFPDKNFKSGKDIGLIAQEVEKIYPEVVFTANDEMKSKSIDYAKLVPALIESIKELQAEIEALKSQLPYQKR